MLGFFSALGWGLMWNHMGLPEQLKTHRLLEALISKSLCCWRTRACLFSSPWFPRPGRWLSVLSPGFAASPHLCSTDRRTSPCQEFSAGSTSTWLQNHIWCFKVDSDQDNLAVQFAIALVSPKCFNSSVVFVEEMLSCGSRALSAKPVRAKSPHTYEGQTL